jgi:hypothetical protein
MNINKTPELHKYLEDIKQDIKNNVSAKYMVVKYNTTRGILSSFLSRNKLSSRLKTKLLIEPTSSLDRELSSTTDNVVKTCNFPIGDPKKKDFHYCDAERKLNSSYCKKHHELCYIKPPELNIYGFKFK